MAFVYTLKCCDGLYYVGSARSIENRLTAHKHGKVKYTKSRLPLKLVFVKEFSTYNEAFIFEKRVKSWKKRKSIEKMVAKSDNIAERFFGVV